jgi:heptose-I-phosphate ethanolaminephosphotransferase
VTLDSNTDESKEFLSFYLDMQIGALAIVFLTIIVVSLIKTEIIVNKNLLPHKRLNKLRVFSLFVMMLVFLKFSGLIVYNLPYLVIKSGIEYRIESEKLGNYKKNKNGNFKNVSKRLDNKKEVYVIIIGESTSRSHLGIYDYYRETTPKLANIKDELLIYRDVISPHAFTIGSLTKTLTLGNYESPEKITEGSIIQLINSAGFETYWLSNQRPIGPYESMITKISLSAKHQKFLTTTLARNSKILDETLLHELDKSLRDTISKKVIFLHLMGTHHDYENRYPRAFNKFIDEPLANFRSEESTTKINRYDNAILYNDFVISEAIKKVDSLSTKSFAFYFSDHGEEMYDDINMAGHNEDIYSQRMFDVPFFLWQSQKYMQEKDLLFMQDRKYMIDDLFHSIADLLDIKANEVDSTRSIFSKHFKERKRIIKDTIDYDTFFK